MSLIYNELLCCISKVLRYNLFMLANNDAHEASVSVLPLYFLLKGCAVYRASELEVTRYSKGYIKPVKWKS